MEKTPDSKRRKIIEWLMDVGRGLRALSHFIIASGIFRWSFLVLTFAFSVASVVAIRLGAYDIGGNSAAVASAFATILLVSLTAQYATQTQKLVEENRQSREQRRESRQKEQRKELMALRRSLYSEIEKIGDLGETAEEEHYRNQPITSTIFPTTIYEQNADKIGLLEEEERNAVIAYYTYIQHLDYIDDERRRAKQMTGWLPWTGPNEQAVEEREEAVGEWIELADKAQEEALEALEKRIIDDQSRAQENAGDEAMK